MNNLYFENSLLNFCFITIFATMLFYWLQTFFPSENRSHYLGKFGIIATNISILLILLSRWYQFNHFPLTNLYESLLFLSWTFTVIHLILEKWSENFFIGAITTPIILFISTFATFGLPGEMQKPTALIPALQSNWLMMHVSVMILSYGALLVGSLLAIVFLVITNGKNIDFQDNFVLSNQSQPVNFSNSIESNQSSLIDPESQGNLLSLAENLDNLSYRTLGIGFPLLTIGILSGAVWANEAWGSYWSWDPKETWALITWFIFAIYFHTRLTKGWKGRKSAYIACFGFIIVWICYLGVNLLGKGLHSYGWIQFS